MRALFGIAILIVAGALTWQIGARLSTDAVGMAVGMLFGALSGIPAALLILGTAAQQPRCGGYDEGFDAGMREAHRQMLEIDARRLVACQSAELQRTQPPRVIVVNPPAPPAPRYTVAHPFEIQPAPARGEHCVMWDLCPDCHLPITPDEHCPEWCGVPAQTSRRQFRITGEVER